MPFEKIRDELKKELPDLSMDGTLTRDLSSNIGTGIGELGRFTGQFIREFLAVSKQVISEMRKKN